MKVYNVLFLLFLPWLQNLSANNHPESLQMPRVVYVGDFGCSIPPPTALNVLNIGSDWVEVSWPSAPGASQYRLQAYDGASGNELGNPILVSGFTNSAVVSTVGNNGSAFVRIWSVCSGGDYNAASFTQSNLFDTIIIDVVVMGLNLPDYNHSEPVGVGILHGVNISWTGSREQFYVGYSYNGQPYGRRFDLNVKANNSPDQVIITIGDQGNTGENLVFLEENDLNNTPIRLAIGFRSSLSIPEDQATKIATLVALNTSSTPQGKWYKSSPGDPLCVVEHRYLTSNSFQGGGSGQISAIEDPNAFTSDPISATPNPFTHTVNIQLPESFSAAGTTMHLYDLMGRERLTYQSSAVQTECSLQTTSLQAGVYFLRLESGGKLKTIKLVKAE